MNYSVALLLALSLLPLSRSDAELQIANIFSDGMVLQQDEEVAIWGWAKADKEVAVSLGKSIHSTKADTKGYWTVTFAPQKTSFEPIELSIVAGEASKTLKDILIGEVWLCGGQSNMAPSGHDNADLEYPSADSEFVRYTRVEAAISPTPADDLMARDGWRPLVAGKMEERRIAPVANYFGVRGVLFYQGENNTFEGYESYAHSFPCVIKDWRRNFGKPELPFGIISLAGNKGMNAAPEPERERIYREMKIDGDKIKLYFDYDPTIDDVRAGKTYKRLPIMDRAREFRGFVIAGKDHRFFPAEVKIRAVKDGEDIRGEHLEAWSESVPEPIAVRYAWENQPNANARGLRGLPVAPFRTDDWPFIKALPMWAPDLPEREMANEALSRQHEASRRERKIEEARKVLRDLNADEDK